MQRGRGGPLTGPPERCSRPVDRPLEPPWGTRLPRPRSHQVRGRSLGLLPVLSLNTTRPGVALVPGPTSHIPWACPGAPQSPAPRGPPSRTPTPLSLPPHLTQPNTSKSNVLLSNSAKVHSRCPLLHPLLPGRCLKPRARLLRSCLRDQKWPQSGAWPHP